VEVWVLEDDALLRESIVLTLRRAGAQVTILEGLPTVPELPRHTGPTVALFDYQLQSEPTGLERWVQLRQHIPQLACLLLTGNTSSDLANRAFQAGVELLVKPIRAEPLLAAIESVIRQTSRPEPALAPVDA
jgi:DNA-binding response OmpR family regulator